MMNNDLKSSLLEIYCSYGAEANTFKICHMMKSS